VSDSNNAPRWNLRRVFRLPSNRSRVRADVDAELAFHLQGRADELMAEGLSRDEAEREARRRFGDYARIGEEVEQLTRHTERRRTLADRLDALGGDVRYALRSLARQPAFASVVVLTLTLGVGATAAIFHAVDRVVLHPLPYPDADRIVFLGTRWGKGIGVGALPAGRFQFWHDHARVFDGLATSQTFDATLGDDESGPSVEGLSVTPDYLRVIGARPMLGRTLAPRDYAHDAPPVALLGHTLWTTRFGEDRNVLGKTIRLDGHGYTIVGVLPASFAIAELETPPAVVTPLVLTPDQLADGGANYTSIGRLRPGVSEAQIASDMESVFAEWREAFPDHVEPDDHGVAVMTYDQIFAGDLVSLLWIMLGATAFVLLLACANVANLVLARTLAREREFAVRVALGAGRGRIVRQVVLEMMILGLVSAGLAIVASLATVRALVGLARGSLLHSTQLALDPRVVAFTMLAALGASVLIGVVVAAASTRADFTRSLAGSSRSSGIGGTGQRTLRAFLVSLESAIAIVLLVGAGLLISSFLKVLHVDGGFRREGIYTATIARPPRDYANPDLVHQFEDRVLTTLRNTPGVIAAGATATLPLERGWNIPTTVEGHPDRTKGATEWRAVSPGYFRMMDIGLVAGRDINETDLAGTTLVALVSESYARDFFKGENPIGRRVLIGCYKGCPSRPNKVALEIVGVVRDLRDASLEQKSLRQTIWVPLAQVTSGGFLAVPAFVIRSNDPSVAATALRRAVTTVEPRMGVPDVAAMSDIVSQSMSWRRFSMVLMISFAALALVLTCIGIYGVASYAVSQRVREIGVRMALGARPRSVVALVVRQGVRPAAVGLVAGLGLAFGLSKILKSMLFGVGPRDPLSFGAVAMLLLGVALVASYVPARRAARIDPASALRAE
jgi:predicted permease